MENKKIFVPIDFTTTSEQSAMQAVTIAQKANSPISLFHVITDSIAKSENEKIAEKLKVKTDAISKEGLNCEYKVATGSIFDEIPKAANISENQLLVIGTHGIKGLKQKLLGADMLKLIRKVNIPCLVVQADCTCRNFNPIVFPVGGHEGFSSLIEATAMIAKLFGSEIHIYSIIRKGDEGSKQLRDNTVMALKYFKEAGISIKRVDEESTVFSVGFAKQTLQYANKINAGLISMMSVKTEEYYYFAQADKEAMINNEFNIPVLCSSGLMG